INATLHMFCKIAQMRVTRRQFRPCVADTDHRPAIEQIIRNTLIFHPASMHECILACSPEPGGGPQLLLLRHSSSPTLFLYSATGRDGPSNVFFGLIEQSQLRLPSACRIAP